MVLTRHPAEESDTLLKLLHRTTSKVEGFVEEWEANQRPEVQKQEGQERETQEKDAQKRRRGG